MPVPTANDDGVQPDTPRLGIAAVTTVGYAGFLAGPPLIGFAVQVVSLGQAFGLLTARF